LIVGLIPKKPFQPLKDGILIFGRYINFIYRPKISRDAYLQPVYEIYEPAKISRILIFGRYMKFDIPAKDKKKRRFSAYLWPVYQMYIYFIYRPKIRKCMKIKYLYVFVRKM